MGVNIGAPLNEQEPSLVLILTRDVGESIVANENQDLEFKVLAIRRGQVTIGVTAPKEIPVHRKEVAERIARERDGRSLEDTTR